MILRCHHAALYAIFLTVLLVYMKYSVSDYEAEDYEERPAIELQLDHHTQPEQKEAFRKEPPDIFRSLPDTYLPDYKSFCWENSTSGRFNCLPGLYLAGMPKCGSTDLFTKLVWHPDLRKPHEGKETHWWTRKRIVKFGKFGKNSRKPDNCNAYINMLAPQGAMKGHRESVLVDGSQSTMWDEIQTVNALQL